MDPHRLLRRILVVGIVDTALLAVLLGGVILGERGLAPVVGPLHGLGFLVEVYLAARGAGERFWSWWYPAAIVLTGGPLGLLVGHRIVARSLPAENRLVSQPR